MGSLMTTKKTTVFGVDVTNEDAKEFLGRFGPLPPCEFCKSENWDITVTTPTEKEHLAVRTANLKGDLGDNFLPIFVVGCEVCGNLKTFLAHPLSAWVKEKTGSYG